MTGAASDLRKEKVGARSLNATRVRKSVIRLRSSSSPVCRKSFLGDRKMTVNMKSQTQEHDRMFLLNQLLLIMMLLGFNPKSLSGSVLQDSTSNGDFRR